MVIRLVNQIIVVRRIIIINKHCINIRKRKMTQRHENILNQNVWYYYFQLQRLKNVERHKIVFEDS